VTGKYGKTRKLPLHQTTADALTQYLDLRNELLPAAGCPALLISTRGNRLRPSVVQHTFRQLSAQTGLRAVSTACRPRLHDYADLRVMPTSVRSSLWRTESRLMRSA
jgi:site-specific recombinase XerC